MPEGEVYPVPVESSPHCATPNLGITSRLRGKELFVADLAAGLQQMGKVVVVYTNGESNVGTERRWIYKHSQWPIKNQEQAWIRDLNHTSWAIRDAQQSCDLIHVQSAHSLPFTRFSRRPIL